MLDQRRRRWPSIKTTLVKRLSCLRRMSYFDHGYIYHTIHCHTIVYKLITGTMWLIGRLLENAAG